MRSHELARRAVHRVGLTYFAGTLSIAWYNSSDPRNASLGYERGPYSGAAHVHRDGAPLLVASPWSIAAVGGGYIIWHNDATDETKPWHLLPAGDANKRFSLHAADGGSLLVGLPWSIVGAGVLIYWHNSVTNEVKRWDFNARYQPEDRVSQRRTVRGEDGNPIFVGPPWRVVGVAYVDDIVWHNSETFETQIWYMSDELGAEDKIVKRATTVDEYSNPIFVGPPRSIVGAGSMYPTTIPYGGGG